MDSFEPTTNRDGNHGSGNGTRDEEPVEYSSPSLALFSITSATMATGLDVMSAKPELSLPEVFDFDHILPNCSNDGSFSLDGIKQEPLENSIADSYSPDHANGLLTVI